MNKLCGIICLAAVAALSAPAFAEDITGKLGVTGRLGFTVPADSEATDVSPHETIDTDTGFTGGGGVIFGLNRSVAAEIDITHTDFDGHLGGIRQGNFETTDFSFGLQYRFYEQIPHLVPYTGVGFNILLNDFTFFDGVKADVDTVLGLHAKAGVDYFVTRRLALTGEVKGLIAGDADIKDAGVKIGNYDPMGITTTFGVRYFFN
jgi:outer membrane protein